MKLHYYPETDSLYIDLKGTPGTQTREIGDGIVADLDDSGTSWDSISSMRRRRWISRQSRRSLCGCQGRGMSASTTDAPSTAGTNMVSRSPHER